MDFRTIRIPYTGRDKYGLVGTGDSIRSIIQNYMGPAGGGSAAGGGDGYGGNENRGGNGTSFFAYLSKTSNVFPGLELVSTALTDTIYVYGFRNMENVQTLIGDMANSGFTPNYDIQGIPESGMTVIVSGNGTTGTSIKFTVNNSIPDEGTLTIPVAVNINDNPLDPYHTTWYNNATSVRSVNLTYSWKVDRGGSSNYVMDLSNERAGVNVSAVTAQGDILYPNSIAALTCSASTYIGTAPVEGVEYSIVTQPQFHAQGLSISTENNKGLLHFASNFNFDGPTLPIDIIATLDNANIATKTMTIDKNYPGQDGQAAVTKWIVTSHDVVKYNPNTNVVTPQIITADAWKQIGGDMPFIDTGETIYVGEDTTTPTQVLPSTGINVSNAAAVSSYTFALKNSNNEYFEREEVPVIWDGFNGESGATGESSWYLTLDNDNASVNADADGNIYSGAVKPICHARLFHGNEFQSGATFTLDNGGATGVTTKNGTGADKGIYTISCSSTTFAFTGDTLNMTVHASLGNVERDKKVMTVTKSKAGADGQDAVSYWLELDYTTVIFDPNTDTCSPNTIHCSAKKQVGQGVIEDANEAVIKYRWVNATGGTSSEYTYTSAGIPVDTGNCLTYNRIRVTAYVGGVSVDQEDIDVVRNGQDGSGGADSSWYLSLDNDNTTINADADGNIYSGAVRPVCHAKLYYGGTRYPNAHFHVDLGGATDVYTGYTQGVGVLTISGGSAFNFSGDLVSITVDGMDENDVIKDTKTMNVSKIKAAENGDTPYISGGTWWIGNHDTGVSAEGEDGVSPHIGQNGNWWIGFTDTGVKAEGQDAVSYWLELDYTEIIIDSAGTWNPTSITIAAKKQVGQGLIQSVPLTGSNREATIYYQKQWATGDWSNATALTSTTQINLNSSFGIKEMRRLRIILYKGTNASVQLDMEDIDIMRDGKNGVDGQGTPGRAGAAIRGPYDYYSVSASNQCWCGGDEGTSTCDDCSQWIDVIVKDGVYYRCIKSYTGKCATNYTYGINNSTYWQSGENFDFVAAKLILADNAKIKFLTGNEIYMMSGNNVSAGIAGGEGVNFWAGWPSPSTNAPFWVDNSGAFNATTGKIGPYTLTSQGLSGSANTGTIPGVGTLKLSSSYSLAGLNITVSASTYRDEYLWNQAGITAQKKNSSNQTTKLTQLTTGGLSTTGDISRSGEQVVTANDASSTKAPILHIVHCTQAEYNSMTKDNNTMYVIE